MSFYTPAAVEPVRLIFDTSAVNALHGDPLCGQLVSALIGAFAVWPTALNISELTSTPDTEDRRRLLNLLRQLSDDRIPLEFPADIVREHALAHVHGQREFTTSLSKEHSGIWAAFTKPDQIDEETRREVLEWGQDMEKSFRTLHRSARTPLQRFAASTNLPFRSTKSHFLRWCMKAVACDFAIDGYRSATGITLNHAQALELLVEPVWSLWLGSWAVSSYSRAIAKQKFGEKQNCGARDLYSAVYLCCAERYITHDQNQYRDLRLISRLTSPRARISRYTEFRSALLNGLAR